MPRPFDLSELCRSVSNGRGRPLHVRGIPGPASRARPCGIWIATDADDWIFVDQQTSPLHRQHIVLHELAHMLCGHTAADLPENDMLGRLFPDLSPAMVRTVLGRSSYQSEYEQEAELLASLIVTRARSAAGPIMPVTDVSAAEKEILRRAAVALGVEA
jgi:IrrE N-terminal-like domain